MATQTTKGSGIAKEDFGIILHGANVVSSRWTNSTLITNVKGFPNWGLPVPNPLSGLQPVKLGSAVSITAITQSGSTGYVNIQKSTHGLSVGDIIKVYGTDVAGYNVTHTVTEVTDANNVKTNVRYSADTSTHGSYKLLSGLFNAMTAGSYISYVVGKDTAGAAISGLKSPAGDTGTRRAIPAARGNQRYHITSWNYLTGAATKGGSAGSTVTYIQPSDGGALTQEAAPTRAIPGELTYSIGTQTPTMADYKQRNG